jgi:hypothetical protein
MGALITILDPAVSGSVIHSAGMATKEQPDALRRLSR